MKKLILSLAVLMALPAAAYAQEDTSQHNIQTFSEVYTLSEGNFSFNIDITEFFNGHGFSNIPGFFDQPQQPSPEKEAPKEDAPTADKEQPAPEVEVPEQGTETPASEQAVPEKDKESDQDFVTESQFEQEVIRLTNEEREQRGLAPLQAYSELSNVARDKSKDMRDAGYFSHDSPNYGSPFEMMDSYGIDYRGAGENIAAGQRTPQEVVNGWMNSDGHRANILNADFTHIGVGHAEGGSYGHYWTQMFVTK